MTYTSVQQHHAYPTGCLPCLLYAQGISCTPGSNGHVTVVWKQPADMGQPPLHKYSLERLALSSATSTWVHVVDLEDSTWYVDQVAAGMYRYRLVAWNIYGRSPFVYSDDCKVAEWSRSKNSHEAETPMPQTASRGLGEVPAGYPQPSSSMPRGHDARLGPTHLPISLHALLPAAWGGGKSFSMWVHHIVNTLLLLMLPLGFHLMPRHTREGLQRHVLSLLWISSGTGGAENTREASQPPSAATAPGKHEESATHLAHADSSGSLASRTGAIAPVRQSSSSSRDSVRPVATAAAAAAAAAPASVASAPATDSEHTHNPDESTSDEEQTVFAAHQRRTVGVGGSDPDLMSWQEPTNTTASSNGGSRHLRHLRSGSFDSLLPRLATLYSDVADTPSDEAEELSSSNNLNPIGQPVSVTNTRKATSLPRQYTRQPSSGSSNRQLVKSGSDSHIASAMTGHRAASDGDTLAALQWKDRTTYGNVSNRSSGSAASVVADVARVPVGKKQCAFEG